MTGERKEAMGGLAKGLEVLRAFGAGRPYLTLSQIAEATSLPPATARRCLLTLQETGYVGCVKRSFFLTSKVLELSAAFLEAINVETLVQPYLNKLVDETGDAASFTVLRHGEITYLARAAVRMLMRLEAHVGSRFPAFCTATGRVLLAGRSAEQVDKYLAQSFTAFTDRTIIDPEVLRDRISAAGQDGYAIVEDELAYGVVSIAVPVVNAEGLTIAAINSSGHSKNVNIEALLTKRLRPLQQTASAISAELRRIPAITSLLVE